MVLLDPVSGSKDTMKHQSSAIALVSSSTWVNFGRVSLTLSDRDEIAGGFQLNDKHINYAIFQLKGLQSILLQANSTPSVNELHVRGNHWITASTMFSKPNTINVYDSLYDSVDEQSLEICMLA